MPQIPIYEQQLSPNAAMQPTLTHAPGEQIGRAVAGFGQNLTGFAADLAKVQDRNAQVEATRIVTDAEVTATEKLLQAGTVLGKTDPTGFAGEMNNEFQSFRDEVVSRAGSDSKNPYLARHLKAGFEGLQRATFKQSMKMEYEALGKFRATQASGLVSANVKLASLDPGRFGELSARLGEQISTMTGVPASWRAEVLEKGNAAMASGAFQTWIKNDPVRAAEVAADPAHPMMAALAPDDYVKLKSAAESAAVDYRGSTIGRGIAASAFGAGGMEQINKDLAKIADDDVRESATKYAKAEYSIFETQKREVDTKRKNDAYNMATDSVLIGTPFSIPVGMESYEAQQIVEYRQRLAEQEDYKAKGGALSDDLAYRDEVQALLYSENKAGILAHHIDQTRLSESSYKTLTTAQTLLRGGRNTAVTDVRPTIQRVLTESGMGKSDMDKKRVPAWEMIASDMVMQQEEVLGRPLDKPEMEAIISSAFRATTQQGMVFKDDVPTARLIDPTMGVIISAGLRGTGIEVTPANIVGLQEKILANSQELKKLMQEEGIPVTATNMTRYFMDNYAEQNKRK